MTSKLSLFAAALAVLGGGATQAQAQAHEGGYLPPPAYAYSQYPTYDYGDRGYREDCGDSFTLAGAHAGVTVLGIDLDGGARLAVGDQGRCHHHQHRAQHAPPAYAQPAPPPPPVSYGYRGYAPPQPMYQQPAYAPPPCGCEQQRPYGW